MCLGAWHFRKFSRASLLGAFRPDSTRLGRSGGHPSDTHAARIVRIDAQRLCRERILNSRPIRGIELFIGNIGEVWRDSPRCGHVVNGTRDRRKAGVEMLR